jgi:hypothetical protein
MQHHSFVFQYSFSASTSKKRVHLTPIIGQERSIKLNGFYSALNIVFSGIFMLVFFEEEENEDDCDCDCDECDEDEE